MKYIGPLIMLVVALILVYAFRYDYILWKQNIKNPVSMKTYHYHTYLHFPDSCDYCKYHGRR